MIKRYLILWSIFLLSTPAFNQMVYEFEDTMQEKRFYSLISEIRCPKCTSGSIASSDVPVSRDIKNKVYELVLDGSTDKEIKTCLLYTSPSPRDATLSRMPSSA